MGVTPSVINTSNNGNGQVVLTVFGNSQFNGSMIRISSVRVGQASPDLRGNGEPKTTVVDANGDGILDLVIHFTRSELVAAGGLNPTTTELVLQADLTDNRQIEARSTINAR
jgi:hypothetical protein